ncbi:hypothetical protein KPL78_02340 [Roseomonas sp. HJA6]|uniref:Uncharacterized protein n=1 Tax=Roseomonas alba TaxID=2846776 RepID=A0ABS7A685_9PROT|nr:DUF6212 domain-containing protein [Neoroseomonas alba]MBW6396664.1 hypothetical protein [Neoroseomonas alba]
MQFQGEVGITQPLIAEVAAGLRVHAPAAALAALFDGRPTIVVDSRLPETVALDGAGARLCHAHFLADGVMLRLGPAHDGDTGPIVLAHPPGAVIAIVAQTPLGARRLAAWWRDHGLEPPTVIVAESGLAALPELLAVALDDAAAATRRVCEQEQRIVALRMEVEQLRGSVAALLQAAAGRTPPEAEIRMDLAVDEAAVPLRLAAGAEARLFQPGMPTAGIARLSLHLAEAANAGLSVRLIGAETDRVLCAWRVPAADLQAGWLHLETPEPVSGRPQTLLISVQAEGEAGEVALSAAAERPGEPALAVATLPIGACLVQPLHMAWEDWYGEAAPRVPRLAPAQMLAAARLDGPGDLDAGSRERRTLTLPAAWETTRLLLGPLPDHCAALRCDLRLGSGIMEARLALGDGAAATEWRPLSPDETRPFSLPAGDAAPEVALELRGVGPAVLDVLAPVLFANAVTGGVAPEAAGAVEPPAPPIVQARPLRALEEAYPREQWPEAPPSGTEAVTGLDGKAHYAEVVLDARQDEPSGRLIDLRLTGLASRGERWREVKFKFGVSGTKVVLEFRRAPSWPRVFEAWPGTESDEYGDKFFLVLDEEVVHGLDRVAPGRDAALVAVLAGIMPRLVAEILTEEDAGAFAEAAGRLAERLGAEG